jgi:hypothetical protein
MLKYLCCGKKRNAPTYSYWFTRSCAGLALGGSQVAINFPGSGSGSPSPGEAPTSAPPATSGSQEALNDFLVGYPVGRRFRAKGSVRAGSQINFDGGYTASPGKGLSTIYLGNKVKVFPAGLPEQTVPASNGSFSFQEGTAIFRGSVLSATTETVERTS